MQNPEAESTPDWPAEIVQLNRFLVEMRKETDRGATLTAAAMIDDSLKGILLSFFVEHAKSEQLIEGFHAPLGTFAARLLAAFALGLIEEPEYNEATTIRRIRNEFAHNWSGVCFETGSVRDLANSLPWRGPEWETQPIAPRARFDMAASMLLGDWLWRERIVKKERRALKSWQYKGGTDRIR